MTVVCVHQSVGEDSIVVPMEVVSAPGSVVMELRTVWMVRMRIRLQRVRPPPVYLSVSFNQLLLML